MTADLRLHYEQQATDCLEAAARHREKLLAVACKLAGSAEGGMDLFQQTCLACHDAIQRRGFEGDRYEFYLLRSLKNLHARGYRGKRMVLVDMQAVGFVAESDKGEFRPWVAGLAPRDAEQVERQLTHGVEVLPTAHAHLAEQVQAKIRELFKPADRITFRLHLEGHSCQDIADLTGRKCRTWVWRRLEKMKATLRKTFQQAYDLLGD